MSELFEDNNLNKTPISFYNSDESLNSSKEINNEFYMNYHFLCNTCKHVPIMEFSSKGKISYSSCLCDEKYNNISIYKIYDYLYNIQENEEDDSGTEYLKCCLHKEKFSFYCKTKNRDFCLLCENCIEHNSHIEFGKDDRYIEEKLNYIKKQINNQYENKISENKTNHINNNDTNYKNQKNIENNNEKGKHENTTNNIKSDIINIKNEGDFGIYEGERNFINLFKIIINDYENYPNYNLLKTIENLERFATLYFIDSNIINLSYEFVEENIINKSEMKFFGDNFVDNNKENCFLIINNKILDFYKTYEFDKIFDDDKNSFPNPLKVRLIERKRKKMINLSFMFNDISSISYISDIGNYDTSNIKEMEHIFYNCKSLHLPDISNWNTKNVIDMNNLFYNCSLVKELPDISRWDTSKVTNMSYMFNNCTSLKEIPDISNWNTENVTDFNNMFENCALITSLPDLSNWKVEKAKYMKCMFKNCISLIKIFDFSNWIIDNDTQTDDMFEGDIGLKNLVELRTRDNNIYNFYVSFYNFFNKKLENIFLIYIFLIILFILFLLLYELYNYFIDFFISYSLKNIKEGIDNPIEYFELKNRTNITYISKLENITNNSKIEEMINNKELMIKNILNFTYINENTKFEASVNLFKFCNISQRIIFLINLVVLLCSILNISLKFRYLKPEKALYLLILPFINNFISLIIRIFERKNTNIFLESIYIYLIKINKYFKLKIPESVINEYDFLYSSLCPVWFMIVNFIAFFVINIILWKIIFNKIHR